MLYYVGMIGGKSKYGTIRYLKGGKYVMITNPEIIENKYKCRKIIANYLVRECNIPILGIDKGYYYFSKTNYLDECLSRLPFTLKILLMIAGEPY